MIKHDGTSRGHPEVLDGRWKNIFLFFGLLNVFHKEKIPYMVMAIAVITTKKTITIIIKHDGAIRGHPEALDGRWLFLLLILFLPESHNEYKYEHYSRDIHKHADIWNNNE